MRITGSCFTVAMFAKQEIRFAGNVVLLSIVNFIKVQLTTGSLNNSQIFKIRIKVLWVSEDSQTPDLSLGLNGNSMTMGFSPDL